MVVASDSSWPVLKESSSVRASIPRTSPRMILSGLKRRVSFNSSSKVKVSRRCLFVTGLLLCSAFEG